MIGKILGAMVGQRIARNVGRRNGDAAGMALGYALASRRLRVPALAGAAALAAWNYWQAKKTDGRLPKPVKPDRF